jgi:hypothetical protein
VLASASGAFAQNQDAGAPPQEAKKERPRLIKTDGQHEDNEQLGGEPSLTETKQEPAAQVDGEGSSGGCDLDCIEAQLDKQDAEEQQKKGTLEVARESGSIGQEVRDDEGDALAAEPSTTQLDEATLPEDRKLPTRLGPVRIRVGKTEDWIGIGFAAQLEFEYDQQFEGAGFERQSRELLEFRRIRFTLSSSFIEGRIRSRFQINLTPSSFDLIDMWFAFTRFKFAAFRVGQFKIPFDRYRATSYAALSFIDWRRSRSSTGRQPPECSGPSVKSEPRCSRAVFGIWNMPSASSTGPMCAPLMESASPRCTAKSLETDRTSALERS